MTYNRYLMNWKEKGKCIIEAFGVAVLIAYLFYDHWIGMIFLPFVYWRVKKGTEKKLCQKRKEKLSKQFQEAMQMVCTSLLAGASIENAWKEAQHEIVILHGDGSDMAEEMKLMNQKIGLRIPLEKVLQEFAERSGIDDIVSFAEVFLFAKRGGGNLVQIIENTVYQMQNKLVIEENIQILVASKKLEQRIMEVVPIAILAYLKLTACDYLSILYANPIGIVFMTICLMIYLAAMHIANKILEIQV